MNKTFFVLVSMLIVLVACGGAESRKEKYLVSAQEYYEQDDCKKAKLDFKNALQIDPKDTRGRVGLARCLVQDQEWRSAYQLLASVVADDPNQIDAKFELAKFYIVAGEGNKSRELVSDMLKLNPRHAGAIALRGISHIKNNTLVAARTDAKQALDIENTNLIAVTLMSALYLKDEDYDKAFNLVKNTIKSVKENRRAVKELQILLIGMYAATERVTEAEPIFIDLIRKYPDQHQYINQLAAIYAHSDQVEKGETLLLEEIERSEYDNKHILSYINYVNQFRGQEQATKALESYVAKIEDNSRLKLALGGRYVNAKKTKAARDIFEQLALSNSVNESNEAKNQLAFMNLKEGHADKAVVLVEEVLQESPTNLRALMLRGTMALARRDAPQAISDFRTMLRDQPNNLVVIRQLAAAYILNGQEDLAKDVVQRAVEIDTSSKELNLLYARLQGKDKEFESAISTVNDVLVTNEDDLASIKTLFDLQIASKDYSGAKETAEKLKLVSKDSPLGYYLSGVLLQSEQKYDEAEQEYLTSLEKKSRANEPLSGLIRLYLSQKENDKALDYLNSLIKNDPDYLVPYNLRGELGIAIKDYKLAKDSFEQAIKRNNKWWIPYRGLSLSYVSQGKKEQAMQVLQRGFDNGANAERLGIDLALMQYRSGNRNAAIITYEKVIQKAPKSALAKNNLAMILVDDEANDQSIAKALKYVRDIEDIEEAASLDTVGWVYYKAGEIDKSIKKLNQAIALAPEAAELHYHLGMAYAEQGSIEKAKEHLKIATKSEQNYTGKNEAQRKLKELL